VLPLCVVATVAASRCIISWVGLFFYGSYVAVVRLASSGYLLAKRSTPPQRFVWGAHPTHCCRLLVVSAAVATTFPG